MHEMNCHPDRSVPWILRAATNCRVCGSLGKATWCSLVPAKANKKSGGSALEDLLEKQHFPSPLVLCCVPNGYHPFRNHL